MISESKMPSVLRRYVIRRATGGPCPEYARLVLIGRSLAAWVRSDERAACASDRWRRIRLPGGPWCPVLGHILVIAQDVALQAYFETISAEGWKTLEIDVRRSPARCLREWRAAGHRIIAAATAASRGRGLPGRLSGWPAKRGSGARSLLGSS